MCNTQSLAAIAILFVVSPSVRGIKAYGFLLILFLFLFAPTISLSFESSREAQDKNQNQIMLLTKPKSGYTGNFSVGFSLQSSYAAAAIIFDHLDGTQETVFRSIEGDGVYRQTIAKLSL